MARFLMGVVLGSFFPALGKKWISVFLLLGVLQPLWGGRLRSDFLADLPLSASDTQHISILGSEILRLGVDTVLFAKQLDTALSFGREWNGGVNTNNRGALPKVQAVGESRFVALYLSYSGINEGTPNLNRFYLVNVNLDQGTMSLRDTLGFDLHTVNPSIFFGGSTSARPVPAHVELISTQNRHVAHWSTDRTQGMAPLFRGHSRFSEPGGPLFNSVATRPRYLFWPSAPTPATPSTADFVISRNGIPLAQAFAALDSDLNETFVVHGPRMGGEHRVYFRWERVQSPLIHKLDSVDILHTGTASVGVNAVAYHLAAASDGQGSVLAAWTDSIGGARLWMRAYNALRNPVGTDIIAVEAMDRRAEGEGMYRTYALRHMQDSTYLLAYSLSGVVLLRQIVVTASGPLVGAPLTVSLPGQLAVFPDLSVGVSHVAISFWRGNTAINRMPEIVRFARTGTVLGDTLVRNYGTNIAFTLTSTDAGFRLHGRNIVSISVDSVGNVLTGYNQARQAKITAYANRNRYWTNGFFLSNALELRANGVTANLENADSVRFLDFRMFGRTANVGLGLQSSTLGTFVDAQSVVVDGALGLRPVRLANQAFRYTLNLQATDGLFVTPQVDSVVLQWNLQPRPPQLMQVQVGTRPWRAFHADTIFVAVNRRDSVRINITAQDLDNPDSLFALVFLAGSPWLRAPGDTLGSSLVSIGAGEYAGTVVLPPRDTIGLLPFDFYVRDASWRSGAQRLWVRYYNLSPRDSLHLQWQAGDGSILDSNLRHGAAVRVQVNDTARASFWWNDSNDSQLNFHWTLRGALGVRAGDSGQVVVPGIQNLVLPPDSRDRWPERIPGRDSLRLFPDTLRLQLRDRDTTLIRLFYLWPNHKPRLDSISSAGVVVAGDTIWQLRDRARRPFESPWITVAPGVINIVRPHFTEVNTGDSVRTFWHLLWLDTINGVCCVDSALGIEPLVNFTFPPERPSLLRLRLVDRTGAATEDTFGLRFPRLDTATAWGISLTILRDSLNFVLGSNRLQDTIEAQLQNRGNQALHITGLRTAFNQAAWLTYSVQGSGGLSVQVRSRTDSSRFTPAAPLLLQPEQSLRLRFVVDISNLRGDSSASDTVFVQSDDFRFPVLRIPVQARWDDLPLIRIYRKPHGVLDTLRQRDTLEKYFPAFSSLVFVFSEPVLAADLGNHLRIYSRLDSLARGRVDYTTIDPYHPGNFLLHYSRLPGGILSNRYADSVEFSARYRTESDHFGVLPPPRNFVHSDVLGIWISNGIIDRSGNALDLRRDRLRRVAGSLDTVLSVPLDTSVLRVVRTWPENGGILDPDEPIRILFNHPLAHYNMVSGDSVLALDQRRLQGDSNSTVRLVTRFSLGRGVELRAPYLERGDSLLVIAPLRKFVSGDSITLTLFPGLSDIFGRTLDGNADGVFTWPPMANDAFTMRFTTGSKKFYTFPNPFRASDPAHREKGTITFKNLHQIRGLQPEHRISIRIFTGDGILVYWTERAALDLRINASEEPIFHWNMQNLAGKPVASGVYIYTIGHGHTVHSRGKVMVIR